MTAVLKRRNEDSVLMRLFRERDSALDAHPKSAEELTAAFAVYFAPPAQQAAGGASTVRFERFSLVDPNVSVVATSTSGSGS